MERESLQYRIRDLSPLATPTSPLVFLQYRFRDLTPFSVQLLTPVQLQYRLGDLAQSIV